MTTEGFAKDGTLLKDLVQFDLSHELADIERTKPWQAGHFAKSLFKKPDLRVVLISMETGATLKEHHADGAISVQVLKGSIRFSTQKEVYDLSPGSVLMLGASIKHEVEALKESAFLLTIAWPDAEKLEALKHRGYGT